MEKDQDKDSTMLLKPPSKPSDTTEDDKMIKAAKEKSKKRNIISKFYFSVFNDINSSSRYLFYIMLILSAVEYWMDSWTDMFLIRFSIALVFSVPFMIIAIENDDFTQINTLYEIKTLCIYKFLILFKDQMTYIEILFLSLIFELFQSRFIKEVHINGDITNENKEQSRFFTKIKVFNKHLIPMLIGHFIVSGFLLYLKFKGHLTFALYDEILSYPSDAYYVIMVYLSSRKLFQYIFKYLIAKNKTQIIPNAKQIFFSLIFIQIAILLCNTKSLIRTSTAISIFIIFIILYENFGLIAYFIIFSAYLFKLAFLYYLDFYYEEKAQQLIYDNAHYMNISLGMSIVFIAIFFALEKDNISKTYTSIYQKIFGIKILFDIWLLVNFIYSLFKNNRQLYYEDFYSVYDILFLSFATSYFFIFIAVFFKLNFFVDLDEINAYFEELQQYIQAKKMPNIPIIYGPYTPIFQIKFYKLIIGILRNFSNGDIKNSQKALKKIERFIIFVIFITLGFVVNDPCMYYFVFFILVQFMFGCVDFIRKIVEYIYIKRNILINKGSVIVDVKPPIKKSKYKLLYILFYPYIAIIWKACLAKLYVIIYEHCISIIQFVAFGKLEPIGNVLYQFIDRNEVDDKYSIKDVLVLFIFIFPNSLGIADCHIKDRKPGKIMRIMIVASFIGLFINTNKMILLMGIIHAFILFQIYSINEETYESCGLWFDMLGIEFTLKEG